MRLIDADALPVDIEYEDVKNAPTVDAVEVVRCKDCEFYTEAERWCRRLGLCGAFDPNSYCSHAERKSE